MFKCLKIGRYANLVYVGEEFNMYLFCKTFHPLRADGICDLK